MFPVPFDFHSQLTFSKVLFSAIVIQWVTSKDNSKDLDQPQGNDRVNSLATENTSGMSWQMDAIVDNLPSHRNLESEVTVANRPKVTG